MRKLMLILSSISMIFCPVMATASELALTDAKIVTVDGEGLTKTSTVKGKFLLTRLEMERVTAVVGDAKSLVDVLKLKDDSNRRLRDRLQTCSNETNNLKSKLARRKLWVISAGSAGIVAGVLLGVIVAK